jgi:hypothetical protein
MGHACMGTSAQTIPLRPAWMLRRRCPMNQLLPCFALLLATVSCGGESGDSTFAGSGAHGGGTLQDSGATLIDGNSVPVDGSNPPKDTGIVCQSTGPIKVPGSSRCMGDLARSTFLFGVCSCTDIDVSGCAFTMGSVNSGNASDPHTGAVGANGRFVGGTGHVEGPIWAAGTGVTGQPVVTGTNINVKQDVHCGGDLSSEGIVSLSSDAYVTGAASSGSVLQIDGALHQPASSPPPTVTPKAGVIIEPVTVGEPCDCSNPIDIAAIVAAVKNDHDDAVADLTPSSLANFDNLQLSLGCGRYYFDSVSGGQLLLTVVGPTAIFVAGDFAAHASIDVQPGGALDLFITGNLHLSGAWHLGSQQAPANTRVYVGGTSLTLEGAFNVDANLYAPKADLSILNSAFSVTGAVFAHRLTLSGNAGSFIYDQAVQDLTGCETGGGGCASCHDCGGATPACKGGACVACTTNSDCCPPQSCMPDGTCSVLVK